MAMMQPKAENLMGQQRERVTGEVEQAFVDGNWQRIIEVASPLFEEKAEDFCESQIIEFEARGRFILVIALAKACAKTGQGKRAVKLLLKSRATDKNLLFLKGNRFLELTVYKHIIDVYLIEAGLNANIEHKLLLNWLARCNRNRDILIRTLSCIEEIKLRKVQGETRDVEKLSVVLDRLSRMTDGPYPLGLIIERAKKEVEELYQ